MLAIGRALMSNPRFLLLDEPSLGLAPLLVQQIRDIIVEINRQGTGVLLVEQNATMALSIADHGYILETGKVVMDKPASELLEGRGRARVLPGPPRRGGRIVRRPSSTTDARRGGCREGNAPSRGPRAERGRRGRPRDQDLHLAFAGIKAIDGVSLGSATARSSPSSDPTVRGKTSIFNCISGVYEPQQGSIGSSAPTSSG
jgi:ABC-type branched-subunit amino acid transport system ATPase component